MRRAAAVLVVLPVLLTPNPARAESDPGSGFASLSLSAVGAGESFVFAPSTNVPGELSVPYAAASYQLGAGTATSSVAWPGEVGASIGSAAIALGAPPQGEMLNDPVLARARTGSGAANVSNDSLPGTTMDAHATPADIHAVTEIGQVQAAGTVAAHTNASARLLLTGASAAIAEATSAVRDVTIAGVVHVAAVTSSARASTDGRHAEASGGTVVTGLTVAGTAVTLGDDGLHVAGTPVPAQQARDAVESALAAAGLGLTLGQPTRVVRAGRVEYATGSLVVTTPLGVLSLGGTQLRLAATRTDPLVPPPPAAGGVLPGSTPASAAPPRAVSPAVTTTQPAPDTSGPLPTLVRTVLQALRPLGLTTGYGRWWLPAGLLLAALAGAALRRLPAAVLPAAPLPCPTEDQP